MLKELQRRIYLNKAAKGFNTDSGVDGINREICHLVEELGEMARSHRRGDRDGVVDAITDVVVYCLGLYELLGIDGDRELVRVLGEIETREYVATSNGAVRLSGTHE